jgi:hypothetical protein
LPPIIIRPGPFYFGNAATAAVLSNWNRSWCTWDNDRSEIKIEAIPGIGAASWAQVRDEVQALPTILINFDQEFCRHYPRRPRAVGKI